MFTMAQPVVTQETEFAVAEGAGLHSKETNRTPVFRVRQWLQGLRFNNRLPHVLVLSWAPLRRIILAWVLPVLLSLSLLFGLHARAKADQPPPPDQLQAYLQDNALSLFEDTGSGLPQIYYFFNHKPVQLTTGNFPSLHPVSSGQYVAYISEIDGLGQVFLADVLGNTITQLSLTAPNEGIFMHGNQIVWQGWDGQHWQIYYYNGFVVQQITSGDTDSINAVTNGQHILYAEQVGPDNWKAQNYDIASGQTTTISQGDTTSTASPHFNDDGTISTAFVPQ